MPEYVKANRRVRREGVAPMHGTAPTMGVIVDERVVLNVTESQLDPSAAQVGVASAASASRAFPPGMGPPPVVRISKFFFETSKLCSPDGSGGRDDGDGICVASV